MTQIEFRLKAAPEYCPGAYSLHLYCKYENPDHRYGEFPHEPEDCETYGEAASQARASGWILHRDRRATCPKCAKRLRAGEKPSPPSTDTALLSKDNQDADRS